MTGFWFRWTLGSVGGFIGGFVGVFVLIGLLTGDEGPEAWGVPFEIAFPVLATLATATMATAQFLILRRHLHVSFGWIPATAVALGLGFAVGQAHVALTGSPETIVGVAVNGLFHGAIGGSLVGLAQTRASRIDGQARWVLVNAGALAFAALIGDSIQFYTENGLGTLTSIFLWQALVAPSLYMLISSWGSRKHLVNQDAQESITESGNNVAGLPNPHSEARRNAE